MDEQLHKAATKEFRDEWISFIYELQDKICAALEAVDDKAKFKQDEWQRAEGKGGADDLDGAAGELCCLGLVWKLSC